MPMPRQFRDRMVCLKADFEQYVIDIEWWNNNRTDAPPMDCEPERIAIAVCAEALLAFDQGDDKRFRELSTRLVQIARSALTE